MPDLVDYAQSVPLNALAAFGYGPMARQGGTPDARLSALRRSTEGVSLALNTAGRVGLNLVSVIAALGGTATPEQLAFQTAGAAPGVVDSALGRLTAAGLMTTSRGGTVALTPAARGLVAAPTISMTDQNAITSDALGRICGVLHMVIPGRKQERIDAITAAFADAQSRERIRADLSSEALVVLERIVDVAGPGAVHAESIGLDSYMLPYADAPRFGIARTLPPEMEALNELSRHGIVGVAGWERTVWIWQEAWPLVDRPYIADWSEPPEPHLVPAVQPAARLPAAVAALDRMLDLWKATPPPALKNGEARLAKTEVRSIAKTLGVDPATVDVASRLAISIGLILRNVVGRSGRGRNVRVDEAWMGDPPLLTAWQGLAPLHRWARLVAEWCTPRLEVDPQLLANRHLILWELARLPDGQGYAGTEEFVTWFAERYAPMGYTGYVRECIEELAHLGVVVADPLSLTAMGRSVLEAPSTVAAGGGSDETTVVVQADLTVIAPPGLRHDLVSDLESVAAAESTSGATVYRIDAGRITRAVQAGRDPVEIVEMLAAMSSTSLPDTVVRLVHDAAAKAGSVRLIAAPTVVAVTDPADLTVACAIKTLKLTRLTDTVAVTEVPVARVRTALERKGMSPETVMGGAGPSTRSSLDEAAAAARRAEELRAAYGDSPAHRLMEQHIQALAARAEALGDVAGRLAVDGPLTMMPRMLEELDPTDRR